MNLAGRVETFFDSAVPIQHVRDFRRFEFKFWPYFDFWKGRAS